MPGTWTRALRLLILLLAIVAWIPAAQVVGQSATPPASSTPVANAGPEFILRPAEGVDGSYFTVEAEPGTTHTLTAVLGNADTEPLMLRTYAGDAFTLVNGGFGVREEGEARTGVSTWIDYEAETLEFAPGDGIERSFTVTVPDDAAPGEYIAGIVLQTAEPIAVEGSSMFDQIVRKSVAIFIIVPGEQIASIEVGAPAVETNVAGQRIVVPVSNTGNVLLKPAGELLLTNTDGEEAFRQPFAMGSVYAGMETTLEVPLPPALPEGDYQITATFTDAVTGANTTIPNMEIALRHDADEQATIEVVSAEVNPMPADADVQFAAVAITIENHGEPVEGVRVILNVEHDGTPVEDFVLAESVTVQEGSTSVEQRYIPLEGWSAGEWTFSISVEAIDPRTESEATLVIVPVESTIQIAD